MTQGSVIIIGSAKTGRGSYFLSLIPTEYESDSGVGVDIKHIIRMLIIGRIPGGTHLAERIRDCLANEVRYFTNDEFDDCISDEDLNYIADKAKIKDQITQALCDAQSRVQDKMRQELRSQYLEVLRETMREYIDSNLESEEGIGHDVYMCPIRSSIRSLRNRNRRGIRIARNISTKRLSGDVFRRLFNLICRWTSCISMKWEWLTHTGLSLEVQRRYRSCVADSFRIGMQWQDVWRNPALTLFVP